MTATPLSWLPSTYDEARTWFGFSGGYSVEVPTDDGLLVAVALFGRSAEALAASNEAADVEHAFLLAVRSLVGRL